MQADRANRNNPVNRFIRNSLSLNPPAIAHGACNEGWPRPSRIKKPVHLSPTTTRPIRFQLALVPQKDALGNARLRFRQWSSGLTPRNPSSLFTRAGARIPGLLLLVYRSPERQHKSD